MSSHRKSVRFNDNPILDSYSLIMSPVATALGDNSSGSDLEAERMSQCVRVDEHTALSQGSSMRTGGVSVALVR